MLSFIEDKGTVKVHHVLFDVSEDNVRDYEARGILVRDVFRRAFSGEERNIVVGDLNKLFQFDDCYLTDVDE